MDDDENRFGNFVAYVGHGWEKREGLNLSFFADTYSIQVKCRPNKGAPRIGSCELLLLSFVFSIATITVF